MSRSTLALRSVCAVALALLLTSQVGAAPPGDAPAAASGPTEIILRVQTPAYTLDAAGLRVAGGGVHDAPGAPALPVWGAAVELPATGAWTLSIDPGTAIDIQQRTPLPAVPVPQPLLPGPLGWPSAAEWPATVPVIDRPDPQIYGLNAFYPASIVQPGIEQWQAGRRLLAVRVFPFQYNPVAGTLRYYADVRVTVRIRSETRQPAAEAGQPAAEARQPAAKPGQPAAETDQPAAKTGQPAAETGQPAAKAGQPAAKAGQPAAETDQPAAKTGQPAAEPGKPAAEPGKPAAEAASQFQPGISNPWALRIRTADRGMIRLTYDALVAADPAVAAADPAAFAVTYLGQPVDIRLIQAAAGFFAPGDSVVFYAEPYEGRYLNHNVYWFTWGESGSGRGSGRGRMALRTVTPDPAAPVVTEITRTLHIERDLRYMSAIGRPKDADHWFDGPIGQPYAPISTTLSLSDTVSSGQLVIRGLMNSGGRQGSSNDRSIGLRLNTHDAGAYAWTDPVDHPITATVPASWLDAALRATPSQLGIWPGAGIVYPDWVEVTYPALARAYGDAIYIEDIATGANEVIVGGFSAPDVVVYDIRDPLHPVIIATPPAEPDGGAYAQHFWDQDRPGPAYFLSTDAALSAPLAIERPVQDGAPPRLAAPENHADYIAIVHRDLWDAIDPLLDHRRNADGFAVAKVDVQQIYDEFSYGRRDPEAIRSFLAYAYSSWVGPTGAGAAPGAAPQYVVLVGDGHYDFTGASGTTLPNLIPPYLIDVDPWLGETAADNRFVSLDGPDDVLPEMAVGRIPAQTPDEVTAVVNKILAYETTAPAGDWQRRVYYVADNCTDGAGNFHQLSDQARLGLPPDAYDARTIYYGSAASCPESDYNSAGGMQSAVRDAFDGGALMLQWFGHAARSRWGTPAEYPPPPQLPVYVLSSNVVPALDANTVWPITFAYTCLSGYFMNLAQPWFLNYMDESVGEALVVTAGRGSVADVSPSGQHVGSALLVLNQGVTKAIFQDRNSRIGPALNAARLYYYTYATLFLDVIDTSILFGDPATRLRLPPHRVYLPLVLSAISF